MDNGQKGGEKPFQGRKSRRAKAQTIDNVELSGFLLAITILKLFARLQCFYIFFPGKCRKMSM